MADNEDELSTETYASKGGRGRPYNRKAMPSEAPHRSKAAAPEHGIFYKIEHTGDEVLHKVAEKSHIPFWGVLLILVVIVLVLLALFFFVLKKYWTKFRESDKGARFKGLDLKSVNLIGQLGKEKVQPESDGLTANMEENEEEQKEVEVKEAEKLGRLKFKLDYDFNSTNVSYICIFSSSFVRINTLSGLSILYTLPMKDRKIIRD